jgi:hypothetical protein
VLLSFAQFEREVTAERIRDKFAASKRKGLWMGGRVPLGYDLIERQLRVNELEAKLVRSLYQRYLALRCVSKLSAELIAQGIVSKQRVSRRGVASGGVPIRVGRSTSCLKTACIWARSLIAARSTPANMNRFWSAASGSGCSSTWRVVARRARKARARGYQVFYWDWYIAIAVRAIRPPTAARTPSAIAITQCRLEATRSR